MRINCFYQSKFAYTIVPWQIREDLQRIKDSGADILTLNVLEQDHKAANENIRLVLAEAEKVGLETWFVPERWVGIFGGVNDFPSVFTIKNMHTAVRDEKGGILQTEVGPVSSLFHEKTQSFLRKKLKECFKSFGFKGVIWDRPYLPIDGKHTAIDYTLFFEKLNTDLRRQYPSISIYWRNNSHSPTPIDGNASSISDIPTDKIVFFNHQNYISEQTNKMETELAELFKQQPQMFCYYDYPANVVAPQKSMEILEQFLKNHKR
ncbi:MAG: hypothetical protein AAF960_06855 [Bacteroidota bacterium]